ncbi:MAG: hypothetical protein R3C52_09010 [Hyphomonadaceae bacterium]
MAREVDKRKTRKAMRKLKRVADRAAEPDAKPLSEWEKEFVEGVGERLEKFGSAFRDPDKGALEEALSARQAQIVRALDRKTRQAKKAETAAEDEARHGKPARGGLRPGGKKRRDEDRIPGSTFRRKSPKPRGEARDAAEDEPENETAVAQPEALTSPQEAPVSPEARRAALRVIKGGG